MIRRLTAQAAPNALSTVLDIGCGWGELMLRVLEAVPAATGIGIDLNEDDLARGRANAEAREMTERVQFVRETAVDTARGPADLVVCLGASHALSDARPPEHTAAALHALRPLPLTPARPGGPARRSGRRR
jgi:cyclopropane fatty-acyl-phospholipid synthase-like methyltransferase